MPEVSIEKLPGIPRIWLDYASGSTHPLLPAPFDLNSLKTRADQIRNHFSRPIDLVRLVEERILLCPNESLDPIRQLQAAACLAVVTRIYPSLFGGPAFQVWKCLMAIKACEELRKNGINAVPVGCLSPCSRSGISQQSIELLDAESELHSLSLPSAQVSDFVDNARELGDGSYSEEVLALIAGFYSAEKSCARATLHLFSDLMKPWGMVFLDIPSIVAAHPDIIAPFQQRIRVELVREQESNLAGAGYHGESEGDLPDSLLWSFLVPAVAHIVDPNELFAFSGALPAFDELGMARPLAWPYSGATLADTRSRRMLEKYNLEIFDLFSGERNLIDHILNPNSAGSVLAKLDSLKSDVERTLSQINGQTGGLDDFEKEKHSCRKKVLYQIQNLRRRFESAFRKREEVVSRQVRRTCNLMAPKGRIQESELSGIYFLLRYTQSVLQSVSNRLNASTFQHQLILMD
jgi:hypothetical protein